MVEDSSNATPAEDDGGDDTLFGGHFVAGCFLVAFGGFYLGLTAFRLNRIAAALAFLERSEASSSPRNGVANRITDGDSQEDEGDHHNQDLSEATDGEDPADHITLWARTYCRQHIPEYEVIVVYRTSLALLLSTACGFFLETVWGTLIHWSDRHHTNEAHVSYGVNETITLLFIVAGGSGWLEASGYLPRDAFRVALSWAFGGEALLWHIHAATKPDTTTAWVYEAISWLAGGTALTMLVSVLASRTSGTLIPSPRSRDGLALDVSVVDTAGDYPCTLFSLYITSYVLIVWQGCWFITAGRHSLTPIQSDRVPCYFIVQGLVLFVLVQVILIQLLRKYKPKRHYGRLRQRHSSVIRERSPAAVEVELNGA